MLKSVEDLLAQVGRGETTATEVFRAVFPDERQPETPKRKVIKRSDDGWFNLRRVMGLKFRWPGSTPANGMDDINGIPIRGIHSELPIRFADGGAIPGERIVGILDAGVGITIYPIHSPKLHEYDEQLDRWIDVTWDIDESSPERFPAQIKVTALNQPGSLAEIATIIGKTNGNIDSLRMIAKAPDFTDMLIDVEVWDLKHLRDILAGLRSLPMVSTVERVMS
jgi:GTP diphosphokinase / guanosine-3',5'-bis(diphosphate) 3'-diphosphatase